MTNCGKTSSLYDIFDSDEKVADVSRIFATDSEDVAKKLLRNTVQI